MTDDIVTRLRECWCSIDYTSRSRIDPECDHDGVRAEAADEIERLRAERDRWFKLADGMAGCLDSSTEAGDLLADYEQAVRDE